MRIPNKESNQDFAPFKMLGALATGAMLGLLVSLPCKQESNVWVLCQIVQTLVAVGVPISVRW